MKKVEQAILLAAVVLCATVLAKTADMAVPVRDVIMAVAALAVTLSIATRAIDRRVDFRPLRRGLLVMFCGYILMMCMSLFVAVNTSEAVYEILRTFFLFAYLCAAIIVFKKDREVVIKTIAVLAAVIGLWGAVQCVVWTVAHSGYELNMYAGTMCNKNLWSSAMLLLLPFSVCVLQWKRWNIVGAIGIITILINLFHLFTRSAILGLVAAGVAVSLFNKRLRGMVIIIILLFIIFACCFNIGRLTNTKSLSVRCEVWVQTIKMSMDNPILGVGAGNWKIELAKYTDMDKTPGIFERSWFRQPHNDFLWVLAETGPVSLVFYVGMFVCAIYYAVRSRNLLVIAGLTAYIVVACFSFPKERVFHSVMLMIYFTLAVPKRFRHRGAPKEIIPSRRFVFLMSVVILGVLSMAVVDFSARYRTGKLCRRIKAGMQWSDILNETDNLSAFATLDTHTAPMYYYRASANYVAGNTLQALYDYRKAIKANPNHAHVLNGMAGCMAILGDLEGAIENYEKALKICPDFGPAKDSLAVVLAEQERINKIYEVLK